MNVARTRRDRGFDEGIVLSCWRQFDLKATACSQFFDARKQGSRLRDKLVKQELVQPQRVKFSRNLWQDKQTFNL